MAIVRGNDPDASLASLLTLAEEGVALAEVSLTGQRALQVLARARRELGAGAPLGAGTVVTGADAEAAAQAGASFLVSPALGEGMARGAELGLPVLPGAFTPTEVAAAHQVMGGPVKVFPASLGGPAYIKALTAPFPAIPLVAVGGVSLDEAGSYLDAGAVAVAVGSPLLGDAPDGGDQQDLRKRARGLLAALGARG